MKHKQRSLGSSHWKMLNVDIDGQRERNITFLLLLDDVCCCWVFCFVLHFKTSLLIKTKDTISLFPHCCQHLLSFLSFLSNLLIILFVYILNIISLPSLPSWISHPSPPLCLMCLVLCIKNNDSCQPERLGETTWNLQSCGTQRRGHGSSLTR